MERKVIHSSRGFYIAVRQSCNHVWVKCSGYFRTYQKAKDALQQQKNKQRINRNTWRAVMYALEAHPVLKEYAKLPFVDCEKGILDKKKLLEATRELSQNDRQLLHLIIKLYEVERLDQEDRKLAKEAIRICFGLLA